MFTMITTQLINTMIMTVVSQLVLSSKYVKFTADLTGLIYVSPVYVGTLNKTMHWQCSVDYAEVKPKQ